MGSTQYHQKMFTRATSRLLKPAAGAVAPASSMRLGSLSTAQRAFSTSRPQSQSQPKILLEDPDGFGFVRHNKRPPKPRKVGVTEIRGPYYSAMGTNYLQDVLDT